MLEHAARVLRNRRQKVGLARARTLYYDGEYAESIRVLDELRADGSSDPEVADLWTAATATLEVQRASALHRQGEHEAARQRLNRVAQAHPHEPDPHIRLALAFAVEENQAAAIEEVERAVELAPSDPLVLYRAAQAAYAAGAYDMARELLERFDREAEDGSCFRQPYRVMPLAVSAIRERPAALDAHVATLRGELALAEGDHEAALTALRQAFADHPELLGLAEALASLHLDRGEDAEAAEVVEAALEFRRGDEGLLRLREEIAERLT